jgi:hypothetical protein
MAHRDDYYVQIAPQSKPEESEMQEQPAVKAGSPQMFLVLAVLLETLALLGGMYWMMTSPGGLTLSRVLLVSGLAVVGGAVLLAVVLFTAKR